MAGKKQEPFSLKVLHVKKIPCNDTPVVKSITGIYGGYVLMQRSFLYSPSLGRPCLNQVFLAQGKTRLAQDNHVFTCCQGVIMKTGGNWFYSHNFPNLYDKLYEHLPKSPKVKSHFNTSVFIYEVQK